MLDEAEESIDTADLPWPDPAAWLELCARSPMVTVGPRPGRTRPLRLTDGRLYLQRYWLQEETVRRQLQDRWSGPAPALDRARARAALDRLFAEPPAAGEVDRQRLAAAVAALSPVSVIAGGPGTGKTTTVAALLTLLADQPGPDASDRPRRARPARLPPA